MKDSRCLLDMSDRGGLPYTNNWAHTIQPYIKNTQVWVRPSVSDVSGDQTTYGTNGELVGNWERYPGLCEPNGYPKSMADIKNPVHLIILMEDIRRSRDTCGGATAGDVNYMKSNNSAYGNVWFRHNAGANWGMADRHAKWFKMDAIGGTGGPPQFSVWTTLAY